MAKSEKRDKNETIQKNVRDSIQGQVESFLLSRIEADAWSVGAKIPSERELAIELDVSRTTVRNAVLALTSRGIFERSVGQGTFVRRKQGPKAEPGLTTGTLGYVVCKEKSVRRPIASEAFYLDVFLGIEGETSRSGRHTLFTYLDDFDPQEIRSFPAFLEKVDGVIVEEARNTELLDLIRANSTPAVLLAPTVAVPGFDLVTMDIATAAKNAVRYLRRLGHERIGIVNGPLGLESARIRFQAWKDAMAETRASADECLSDGNEGWSAEAGHTAMVRLLERCPDLTAVFCANDLLAIGALSALAERSVRVPEDLSIIGFDDTVLARHASPPLTTMRIHSRDMARAAARRLLERVESSTLQDEHTLPPVKIEFPIDLVERKSCKEVKRPQE
ncbi:MAG TPA: GntR family transcriptional regulator [Spirochaetia bacterium]|nr:GntR family transcriptional regulator [Spirochaetia bacterium]